MFATPDYLPLFAAQLARGAGIVSDDVIERRRSIGMVGVDLGQRPKGMRFVYVLGGGEGGAVCAYFLLLNEVVAIPQIMLGVLRGLALFTLFGDAASKGIVAIAPSFVIGQFNSDELVKFVPDKLGSLAAITVFLYGFFYYAAAFIIPVS